MEKGAAFITALITLISGTLSATLGLGVVTGLTEGFGAETGNQAELTGFVQDINGVCDAVEGSEDNTVGTVPGSFNLDSGQEVQVDVSQNSVSIPESDLSSGEDTESISCEIVNEDDITYSDSSSYIIYPREGGVSLG